MELNTPSQQLEASFDIVARQEAHETAIGAIREDVDEVKARLDQVSRAAARPALDGGGSMPLAAEVKSFVDGYLRHGREHELKSVQGTVPGDGGFAVPRQIDAAIARALTSISPIRRIAQVVQTGTAGYRKLITTGATSAGRRSR